MRRDSFFFCLFFYSVQPVRLLLLLFIVFYYYIVVVCSRPAGAQTTTLLRAHAYKYNIWYIVYKTIWYKTYTLYRLECDCKANARPLSRNTISVSATDKLYIVRARRRRVFALDCRRFLVIDKGLVLRSLHLASYSIAERSYAWSTSNFFITIYVYRVR